MIGKAMDIDNVLYSFSVLAGEIIPVIKDVQLCRNLISILDGYPFPPLNVNEDWRRKQIRSALEQQIALLESQGALTK